MPRESCNLTIQPAKIQTGCAMFLANEIRCRNHAVNIDIAQLNERHEMQFYISPVTTCNFELTMSLFTAVAIIAS